MLVNFIVLANILWGFVPLFVVPVFAVHPYSTFTIVFIRFVTSGIILFGIASIQLLFNALRVRALAKDPNSKRFAYFNTSLRDLVPYLKSKNKVFGNHSRQVYIIVLAFFGVTLNIATYFISIQELPIIIALIGSPGGVIIAVSAYNLAKGKERMSMFKGIYIFLMIMSLFLSVAATPQTKKNQSITIEGLVALVLNIISMFVFFVYSGRDGYAVEEKIWKRNKGGNYRLMRLFIKLSIYTFEGGLLIIPVALVSFLIPDHFLHAISSQLFIDFLSLGTFFANWRVIVLIVLCTVGPNLANFFAAAFWDSESSLTIESWFSILNQVDTLTSTLVSVLAGFQVVNVVFFVITFIVLSVAILLRYVHEAETKVNAIIFLKVKFGAKQDVLRFLSHIPEIRKFYLITGPATYMIKATFGSMKEYFNFITLLETKPEIKIKFEWNSFIEDIQTT